MPDKVKSLSAFHIDSDELGVYAKVSVDPLLYGLASILKTAYWFTDQCYVYLANRAPFIEVEFRLKQGDSEDLLTQCCGQFLNNLLDQSVRQVVLGETAGIRDALIKKAFFDAKAAISQLVIADESNRPTGSQSYKDDPLNISGRR